MVENSSVPPSTSSSSIVRPPQRIDSRATAETLSSRDLLDDNSHTRTPETAQLSISNDRVVEECQVTHDFYEDDFFRTPIEGVSEVIAAPHMLKGLDFMVQEADYNTTTRYNSHMSGGGGGVNSDSTEDGTPPSSNVDNQIHNTPESIDHTCATDATLAHSLDTEYLPPPAEPEIVRRQQRRASASARAEASCLVTFQRRIEKQLVETTLHARADREHEDSMADLVRRLQKSAGVLTFGKKDLKRLGKGTRQIVFILPQINRATFSKEEFGQMTTSEIMQLTPERPVVIEVTLEKTVSGEQLEIF